MKSGTCNELHRRRNEWNLHFLFLYQLIWWLLCNFFLIGILFHKEKCLYQVTLGLISQGWFKRKFWNNYTKQPCMKIFTKQESKDTEIPELIGFIFLENTQHATDNTCEIVKEVCPQSHWEQKTAIEKLQTSSDKPVRSRIVHYREKPGKKWPGEQKITQ